MKEPIPAGRCISRLANQVRRRLDSFSTKSSISGSQGRILHFILAQSEDIFQKDIEEEFYLRPSTATGILRLMEKNGLISRVSMPNDARLKKIILSPKAMELKDFVVRDVTKLEEDMIRGIPEEELQIFYKVVHQMSENLSV